MDGTHTGKFGAESVRAALRRVRGSALNFVPRDYAAEAHPADETAEAEQGQRSAIFKRHFWRAENTGLCGILRTPRRRCFGCCHCSSIAGLAGRACGIQRVAKAPRSRGNPFLPAYAGQKFLPPGIPLGTKLSAEPRTRPCGLAHSQRSISLYVSRPSAHVGWTGLFQQPQPGAVQLSGLGYVFSILLLFPRR